MISARRAAKSQPAAKQGMVAAPLPLQNGDRLTAGEFLRRYDAMPEVKKAELINGIVYMASPVRARQHGIPDNWIQGWLFYYTAHTPGTRAAANSTVRFDADTVPQPDALLMIEPGGQARIGADGYVHGAPELVAEVAASSVALDLHDKRDAYRRAGVLEYVVWRPVEQKIDWWVLEDEQFVPLAPDKDGLLHSRVFSGLTLDTGALLRDDAATVLSKLAKGLHRAAHKAFVKRLSEKA
jgi:Uma2 family endonuclease